MRMLIPSSGQGDPVGMHQEPMRVHSVRRAGDKSDQIL